MSKSIKNLREKKTFFEFTFLTILCIFCSTHRPFLGFEKSQKLNEAISAAIKRKVNNFHRANVLVNLKIELRTFLAAFKRYED